MWYDKETWENEISPKRWEALYDFLYSVSAACLSWALAKNIITEEDINTEMSKGDEEFDKWLRFLLLECHSRRQAIMGIRDHFGKDAKIENMPLLEHYDFLVNGEPYESKFRINDNDQYRDDRIDEEKQEWIVSSTTSNTRNLIYSTWDGITRVYNMDSPDSKGWWLKPEKSAIKTNMVWKPYVGYNPINILWSASTAMPDLTYYMNDQ